MKSFYLFFIVLACCAISCDVYRPIPEGKHDAISFENNSADSIYIADFPREYYPFSQPEEDCVVPPGTSKYNVDSVAGYSYEELFAQEGDGYYYTVYVIPHYYKDDNSWKYDILVRYYLTLEDLISLNFHLSYPPTRYMKNVKMFPAYEIFDPKARASD